MEQNFLNSPSERERGGRKESEETEKVFCRKVMKKLGKAVWQVER